MIRALVVYCHPNPNSFTASVKDQVVRKLKVAAAECRVVDLYAEGFDPAMGKAELGDYLVAEQNWTNLRTHIDNLTWCNALVFVYPTWWYGLPAMLKGWLDRTMLPGVAFHMPTTEDKRIRPGLTQIARLGLFTTGGATWLTTQVMGAPGKRTILRAVKSLCSSRVRTVFAIHYQMDTSTEASRAAHLKLVAKKMDRLLS